MSLEPGNIVIIPYAPPEDPLNVKPRPCLVVSGAQFNQSGPDVILVPMSSVLRYGDEKQIIIETDDPCFPETKLKVSSAIKCGRIFAYEKAQIHRRLGIISSEILEQVRKLLVNILVAD